MRLGTLLLRDAVITLSQLEAALRSQILYGGRLGTNLVELGHVDVDTLGRYLARVLDVPHATAEQLEAASREALQLVGADRADRFTTVPLGFEDGRISMALRDPRDHHMVAQLERELDAPVRPLCAAELRILYYLERHYGLKRRARFLRDADDGAAPPEGERRRTLPPPMSSGAPVRLAPRAEEQPAPASATSAKPRCSLGEAVRRVDEAAHRDAIGDAILDFTVGRFAAAALFIVKKRTAVGWKVRGARRGDIEQLSLSLAAVSALQTAADGERAYRGEPPTAGRPIERELWAAIGVERDPKEVVAVPISVRGRVVNLAYAHGVVDDDAVDQLKTLCSRAGEAYFRLIQSARGAG